MQTGAGQVGCSLGRTYDDRSGSVEQAVAGRVQLGGARWACLAIGNAKDATCGTAVLALEEAGRQHLGETGRHRIPSNIGPPATPVNAAPSDLVDTGEKVPRRGEQQLLGLSVSCLPLPLLQLWRQQRPNLWAVQELPHNLARQREATVAKGLAAQLTHALSGQSRFLCCCSIR